METEDKVQEINRSAEEDTSAAVNLLPAIQFYQAMKDRIAPSSENFTFFT